MLQQGDSQSESSPCELQYLWLISHQLKSVNLGKSPRQGRNKLCLLLTFTSATPVSDHDHDGERPEWARRSKSATWKRRPWHCFSIRGLWNLVLWSLSCLRGSSELFLRSSNCFLWGRSVDCYFFWDPLALPRGWKLRLTVYFRGAFSAHLINDSTIHFCSLAWVDEIN